MANIKIILVKHRKRDDGSYPIALRIIHDRKIVYNTYLGYDVKEKDWDEKEKRVRKSHPNSVRLNNLIIKKLSAASDKILELEGIDLSPNQVKSRLKKTELSSFLNVSEDYLKDLQKLGKYSQLAGEKPRVKHFKGFMDEQDISFPEITIPLLKKFIVYLKSERGINDRTIMNHLVVIRSIYNRAINLGLVESKYYPFGPGKIQIRFPESMKIGLSAEEVLAIEKLELDPFSPIWHTRHLWLCSFYLAGIRVSDVIKLKWKDFMDGRLFYAMGKNSKVVSLKVPEKVVSILKLYQVQRTGSVYIFPYLLDEYSKDPRKLYQKVRNANFVVNEYLKEIAKLAGIEKNLTMHISRHTFGNIAGEKIAPQLLQKLYRHSDLKTTIGYQSNFIFKDVDKALDDVINF